MKTDVGGEVHKKLRNRRDTVIEQSQEAGSWRGPGTRRTAGLERERPSVFLCGGVRTHPKKVCTTPVFFRSEIDRMTACIARASLTTLERYWGGGCNALDRTTTRLPTEVLGACPCMSFRHSRSVCGGNESESTAGKVVRTNGFSHLVCAAPRLPPA